MSPKAKEVPANVFIKGFKEGGIRAAKQGAERTAAVAVAAHVVNASPPPLPAGFAHLVKGLLIDFVLRSYGRHSHTLRCLAPGGAAGGCGCGYTAACGSCRPSACCTCSSHRGKGLASVAAGYHQLSPHVHDAGGLHCRRLGVFRARTVRQG